MEQVLNRRRVDPARQLTVGLLWHSVTSDNLGVRALTESQLLLCTEAARRADVDIDFVVFGTSGEQRSDWVGNSVRLGSPISLRELVTLRSPYLREVRACHVVLDIGEGDSFTDIYGTRRFRVLLATKIAALLLGRPLVLSPQTIGPFNNRLFARLAIAVMRRCRVVLTRDHLSTTYLANQNLTRNVREAIDVAFRLPYQRPEFARDGKVRVGINVSGLLYAGGYTRDNQFGLTLDYKDLVHRLIAHFSEIPEVELWLVPHVLSDRMPVEDDRVPIRELCAQYPSVRAAPEFRLPSEAKSFISGLDFFTGARMHACIAAFSSGVPVVPLAYSRKFNGLFESLGYHALADAKAHSTDEAVRIIRDGYQNRDRLAHEVAVGAKMASVQLDAYVDELVSLFASVTAARRAKGTARARWRHVS